MEGTLVLDWIMRLLSWAMMAGIGWVMVALYASMRRKGNLRIAEIYWWFLTVQAVIIAILAAIKVYEGLDTARVLFVIATLASGALIWARITRPMPVAYSHDDSDI